MVHGYVRHIGKLPWKADCLTTHAGISGKGTTEIYMCNRSSKALNDTTYC